MKVSSLAGQVVLSMVKKQSTIHKGYSPFPATGGHQYSNAPQSALVSSSYWAPFKVLVLTYKALKWPRSYVPNGLPSLLCSITIPKVSILGDFGRKHR